ncbi:MAG: asparagine synthase (glutamine-hydrolyzing) [Crocinitomicaceae bacterium]|nr:asparagine synthase (glutamine-hydrolyzing) [Crocinitomicaceae bacterium]
MCGISGYIDFKKRTPLESLVDMTNSLEHRGPDGAGFEHIDTPDYQIGLGHRRLSILELSDLGKQPMAHDQFWMTFNGEIYNYKEIKTELATLGHSFKGDSDSEMILHAYQQWGSNCVDRFIGMFAIVILDTTKNEVFCVRDRTGVKPLFYYWKKDLFLFASELKAFHKHPNFEKEINRDAISAFMQYGNIPTPHCIFNDCAKVKPGHSLTINLTYKTIVHNQYWNVYDYYNKPKSSISYEEAKVETKELLKSAFNYRMVSDVPVGVFLSGGYDSACVTAILQADRTEKIKTYTIGVPDIGLNEAPYAKDVAKHLGTDHTEFECTEKEAIELIEDLPFYFDEPFADSSAIPTTIVSRLARQEVTVALSADGGDEIYAGYNRYDYLARYGKKLNRIPGIVRHSMVGAMNVIPSERIPILKNKYNFHNRYEKLKNVLKNPSNKDIMLSLSQQFTDHQMEKLMTEKNGSLETSYLSTELNMDINSPLAYMMAVDYQTYLVDDIMQKMDRAAMTHGLEGREPFLDHRIIEHAAQLPDHFKYHEGAKKRILRDIVHEYIPLELMDRPKMGFAIPIADWMLSNLKDLVHSYVNEKNIREQGFFDWKEIEKLMNAFYGGKKEYDMKIWYLLMFQMWYSKWM